MPKAKTVPPAAPGNIEETRARLRELTALRQGALDRRDRWPEIAALAAEILDYKEATGLGWNKIAQWLTKAGHPVSGETLRQHLGTADKAAKARIEAPGYQHMPPTSATQSTTHGTIPQEPATSSQATAGGDTLSTTALPHADSPSPSDATSLQGPPSGDSATTTTQEATGTANVVLIKRSAPQKPKFDPVQHRVAPPDL